MKYCVFGNIFALSLATGSAGLARDYHVSPAGDNGNVGDEKAPLRTIQRAADLAQPGDTITVHAGLYRERINPPRGGESDERRITYQAAPGEPVEIKGSEVMKGWERVGNDTWKVTIPNAFFGHFNPYSDVLGGEWYLGIGFPRHSGTVYVKGEWTEEAHDLKAVLAPVGTNRLWKAEVGKNHTTIWAQIIGVDPNAGEVEISARQSVFYPDKPGRNYITVRGFIMRNAATPWAGAMSEQVGLIGTHWSKGWIIESNTISHSMCTGITLGRYALPKGTIPPTTAVGYVECIRMAVRDGWSRERIGSHIVRDNEISYCEKNGIHGSLGGIFSTISGNRIHDIAIRKWVYGEDTAGIKLLGGVGVLIKNNRIYRCGLGIWLDWMAQGARVSANLLHDNLWEMFLEVNHGPLLVDNNLFLSDQRVENRSEGVAFVHNLFTGVFIAWLEPRRATPYFKAHSVDLAGVVPITTGDDRFFNNIFIGRNRPATDPNVMRETMSRNKRMAGFGIGMYDFWPTPPVAEGNLYYRGARPASNETGFAISSFSPVVKVEDRGNDVYLSMTLDPALAERRSLPVTAARLGVARVPSLPFEAPDGAPMDLTRDYFGTMRDLNNPTSGSFENTKSGTILLRVWPFKY
jgi:alpha-N-arabinofuranosidase